MLGIFHTCVGKANDMLISPWATGDLNVKTSVQGKLGPSRLGPGKLGPSLIWRHIGPCTFFGPLLPFFGKLGPGKLGHSILGPDKLGPNFTGPNPPRLNMPGPNLLQKIARGPICLEPSQNDTLQQPVVGGLRNTSITHSIPWFLFFLGATLD